MIEVLSPSFEQYNQFYPVKSLGCKGISEDLFERKLESLRKRMSAYEQQIHVIKKEQASMRYTAVVIQHDQEEIAREQKKLKEGQLVVKQDIQQLQQNHVDIQQNEALTCLIFNALTYSVLNVYRNQANIEKELTKIKKNRPKNDQQTSKTHQNISRIAQNFQRAWKKVRAIENKVVHIQETHAAIDKTVTKIEEKQDNIRMHISLLVPGFNQYEYEKRDALGIARKIDQLKASGWLNRIQDFCLWLITAICKNLLQSIQYLKPWQFTADFSVQNPSFSSLIQWTAMGALATTGMVEIHFSMDYLTLKGSVIDLKSNG